MLFEVLYKDNPKGIAILGIESSKDLGKISFKLHEKGIVNIPDKITLADFNDQFEKPEK